MQRCSSLTHWEEDPRCYWHWRLVVSFFNLCVCLEVPTNFDLCILRALALRLESCASFGNWLEWNKEEQRDKSSSWFFPGIHFSCHFIFLWEFYISSLWTLFHFFIRQGGTSLKKLHYKNHNQKMIQLCLLPFQWHVPALISLQYSVVNVK